jgi:hypothetical protein
LPPNQSFACQLASCKQAFNDSRSLGLRIRAVQQIAFGFRALGGLINDGESRGDEEAG